MNIGWKLGIFSCTICGMSGRKIRAFRQKSLDKKMRTYSNVHAVLCELDNVTYLGRKKR